MKIVILSLLLLPSLYLLNLTPKMPQNAVLSPTEGEQEVLVYNIDELTVREQIEYIALLEDFDAEYLIRLAFCESSLNPNAIGKLGEVGLYQYYLKFHPDVSRECALDVECSTRKTIEKLKQGKHHLWTCHYKI